MSECCSETSKTPSQEKQSRLSLPTEKASSFTYCPANMKIVKVLRNDTLGKCLCLHAKFSDSLDKDAIVILSKSAFPGEENAIFECQLGQPYPVDNACVTSEFPPWCADEVTDNDIYHRFNVTAGLEKLNVVDMTVIHPADEHHFAKYSTSAKRIIYETPSIYTNVIVPFLTSSPRDLAWVDNILNGTAEVERVLFSDPNESFGFTFVLDYRWNGTQLNQLHCLGLARSSSLTCLRDLRACHIPMLQKMLEEGRKCLVAKCSVAGDGESSGDSVLREDQILAYFHYPPTFYRLHMHFTHIDGSMDGGTQAGKAHLAEEVIANLELDDCYYANRTMTMYLHNNHVFLTAIRAAETKA